MQFALFTLLGAGIGWGLGALLGRRIDSGAPPAKPSALSWTALGLGAAALIMVLAGVLVPAAALSGVARFAINSAVLTIALAVAAVIDAVWALVRGDRHWVAWTALVVAALPALFWLVFLVGSIMFPGG